MDVTPGTDSVALTVMLQSTLPAHPIARSEWMTSWWSRSALIALVIVLGLLQGSRAALGNLPLGDETEAAAEATAETPAAPAPERDDALRGRFFRPAGSSAVRPGLRLEQSSWRPDDLERVATLACPSC